MSHSICKTVNISPFIAAGSCVFLCRHGLYKDCLHMASYARSLLVYWAPNIHVGSVFSFGSLAPCRGRRVFSRSIQLKSGVSSRSAQLMCSVRPLAVPPVRCNGGLILPGEVERRVDPPGTRRQSSVRQRHSPVIRRTWRGGGAGEGERGRGPTNGVTR